MSKQAAIVLHNIFFKNSSLENKVEHSVILKILKQQEKQDKRKMPFTYRYLLGDSEFKGILSSYIDKGFCIDLFQEDYFATAYKKFINHYEHFNFQFAIKIPVNIVYDCLQNNKIVYGWAPPELDAKSFQAIFISCQPQLKYNLLPRQLIIPRMKHSIPIRRHHINKWFLSRYIIAKSIFSAKSKMPDGSEYRIFRKENWGKFKALANRKTSWFEEGNGLILSEFIEAAGQGLNAYNHVVHKIHLSSGYAADTSWPFTCQTMSSCIYLDGIGSGIKCLNEIFQHTTWGTGSLEAYKKELTDLAQGLSTLPCLFGIDAMITSKGKLVVLELNKVAATFLEIKGSDNKTPLEKYIDYILSYAYKPKSMLKKLRRYMSFFDRVKKRGRTIAWIRG